MYYTIVHVVDEYFVAVTFNSASAAQLSSRKYIWLFCIFNPIVDIFIRHSGNGAALHCETQAVCSGFKLHRLAQFLHIANI